MFTKFCDVSDLSWCSQEYLNILLVISIEIGDGKEDSYLLPLDIQVEKFCQTVRSNENLDQG
ncbi:unnamed protein product, partial [Adineta steineri]